MKIYDYYITPEEYELAEKNGVTKHTLESRVRYLGWEKERAINTPLKKEKYKELNIWKKKAIENEINVGTFFNRIEKLNWSYEKAATTKEDKRRKYPLWIREELKKNGINYYTFLKRIEKGWDLERAYTEKTMTNRECLGLGREKQKKKCIGPYSYMRDSYKLLEAKGGINKCQK